MPWNGSQLFVWGGQDAASNFVSHGAVLDAVEQRWSLTPAAALAPRQLAGIAWVAERFVVWGGMSNTDGLVVYGDGAVYDPVAMSWRQATNGPSPRYGFSFTSLGDRVFLWAGIAEQSFLTDGAFFDPIAGGWASAGAGAADLQRGGHSAVWTGQRVIVWGGLNDTTYPVTGYAYDPTTDAWSPIATAGAPAGRASHTAVWTGSLMIVWGGATFDGNAPTRVNTGGIYEPSADAWRPMSTTNAPSPRNGHRAVWTGRRMIVFGGIESYNGPLELADGGGIYDPETDSWTPMSTAGGPAEYFPAAAAWDGCRLIVHGSACGDAICSETWFYEPPPFDQRPDDSGSPPSASLASLAQPKSSTIFAASRRHGLYI